MCVAARARAEYRATLAKSPQVKNSLRLYLRDIKKRNIPSVYVSKERVCVLAQVKFAIAGGG